MQNRLDELFKRKDRQLLSIYLTAGFPRIDSTVPLIRSLEEAGADFLEVGFPFSDPLADGPVIQETSSIAIRNGMNLRLLLGQLAGARNGISIPLILMGYLNPVLQMGMGTFCRKAEESGVSGVIIPDLPPEEYRDKYRELFNRHKLHMIFLVTPGTTVERIRMLDNLGSGFIYAVSASSTTGRQESFSREQEQYLEKLGSLDLGNPVMTGFGIHNRNTLETVWKHTSGAIIGTAYLKALMEAGSPDEAARSLFGRLGVASR